MPDICSTNLRADLAAGLDRRDQLHPSAAADIARRGLYGHPLARLKATLPPGRWRHTVEVRRLAEALARRWSDNPRQASLAALLHDCGRTLSEPEQAKYARTHRLAVPRLKEIIRCQPELLHAYVGADLARRRFGCRDAAVLSAVRRHTLGARRLSRLDKILYVADAASEERGHAMAAPLRRLARRDLDAAFAACLAAKLRYAIKRGAWLHPLSIALWNDLRARP